MFFNFLQTLNFAFISPHLRRAYHFQVSGVTNLYLLSLAESGVLVFLALVHLGEGYTLKAVDPWP
jgi:hypothetical protein